MDTTEHPRELTAKQVAQICGVSERTPPRWCSRRATARPFLRQKRGRHYIWPAERLFDWLVAAGKDSEASRLRGYLDGLGERETVAPAPELPPLDLSADLAGGEMDIFLARDLIARMLVQGVQRLQSAGGYDVHTISRNVREMAETLRKLEIDALTVDEKLKRVVPVAFVRKLVGRILANARTNLLSLRYSMSQELAVLNTADEVEALLEARFTAALRELEQDFLTSAIEDYEP